MKQQKKAVVACSCRDWSCDWDFEVLRSYADASCVAQDFLDDALNTTIPPVGDRSDWVKTFTLLAYDRPLRQRAQERVARAIRDRITNLDWIKVDQITFTRVRTTTRIKIDSRVKPWVPIGL